jgi:transcriptional regulator NrdR family protein
MYGTESDCPKCGSSETRVLHETTCDSLDGVTIRVTCDNCGNSGEAEMIPTCIYWDDEGEEENE